MKRVLLIFTAVFIVVTSIFGSILPAYAVESGVRYGIRLTVNGEELKTDPGSMVVGTRTLVPARFVLEKMGARVDWDVSTAQTKISIGDKIVILRPGSRSAVSNGEKVYMDSSPAIYKDRLMIPVRFVAEEFGMAVGWDVEKGMVTINKGREGELPVSRSSARRQPVVVIDPGHGGSEVGAVYGGVYEKDLNLDISKRLNTLLQEQGIQTYMTRSGDEYLSLYKRTEYANQLRADLLVSIHNNAAPNLNSYGSMTLYSSLKNRNLSLSDEKLARIIQTNMASNLSAKDLGVIRGDNLAVLRTSIMPAALVEVGFMSNNMELSKLKQPEYRQKAAEAVAKGIIKALDEM